MDQITLHWLAQSSAAFASRPRPIGGLMVTITPRKKIVEHNGVSVLMRPARGETDNNGVLVTMPLATEGIKIPDVDVIWDVNVSGSQHVTAFTFPIHPFGKGADQQLAELETLPTKPEDSELGLWLDIAADVLDSREAAEKALSEASEADKRAAKALAEAEAAIERAANTVGKPGEPGKPGTPGKNGTPGKDGEPGKDGVDGHSVIPYRVDVGETNRTSELQEWILDLASGKERGYLAPGIYVAEGLVLPALTGIRGEPMSSRFGTGTGNRLSSTVIRRPAGSTSSSPVVSLEGAGSHLSGVTIHCNLTYGTGVTMSGFEASMTDVRVFQGRGIGLDVQKANNAKIDYIWVDNCGSSTQPAVRIRSVTGAGHAVATNAQIFNAITIERANNTALQVGSNEAGEHPIEWCTFSHLHVESPDDNGALGNSGPLIDVATVKGITFLNPMIYGGPGPLIRHEQTQSMTSLDSGGIRIIGGQLLGQEPFSPSPHLVRLVSGNNFAAVGTKFARFTDEAIRIDATYGSKVFIDPTITGEHANGGNGKVFTDSRTVKVGWSAIGQANFPDGATIGGDVVNSIHSIASRASTVKRIDLKTLNSSRWHIQANATPETGTAEGSDFEIVARANDGSSLGTAFSIKRSSRQSVFHYPPKLPASSTATLPTAAAAGAGSMAFDTTLNKVVVSNGTAWTTLG